MSAERRWKQRIAPYSRAPMRTGSSASRGICGPSPTTMSKHSSPRPRSQRPRTATG